MNGIEPSALLECDSDHLPSKPITYDSKTLPQTEKRQQFSPVPAVTIRDPPAQLQMTLPKHELESGPFSEQPPFALAGEHLEGDKVPRCGDLVEADALHPRHFGVDSSVVVSSEAETWLRAREQVVEPGGITDKAVASAVTRVVLASAEDWRRLLTMLAGAGF